MARIPFTKVEGLGNDFVIVDLRPGKPGAEHAERIQDPATVKAVCDRHFGVGADGILAVLPSVSGGDARMRVLNADGSEAEMCGNGIRCVAKYLYESDPSLRLPVLRIDTSAGRLDCAMDSHDNRVETVAVEMGKPRLTRGEIPMTGSANETVVRLPVTIRGRDFVVTGVSMGNPHAVIFIDDESADLHALAVEYGPALETDPLFPRRTNVEFARVQKNAQTPTIDLVVWERGVGITLACGTGACATAVAAYLEGRGPGDREVRINLPGGPLFITVNAGRQDPDHTASLTPRGVLMRGPARTVFRAELDL